MIASYAQPILLPITASHASSVRISAKSTLAQALRCLNTDDAHRSRRKRNQAVD
jgi:hypothetical protein